MHGARRDVQRHALLEASRVSPSTLARTAPESTSKCSRHPVGEGAQRTGRRLLAGGDHGSFKELVAAAGVEDAFQAEFDGSRSRGRSPGTRRRPAGARTLRGGSITVAKRLVPADDPGRFALKIDGEVAGGAEAVGDGDSTGTIAVAPGSHMVSESAARGTELGDYTIEIAAATGEHARRELGRAEVGQGRRRRGDEIVCTITNNAKPRPGRQPHARLRPLQGRRRRRRVLGLSQRQQGRGDDRGRKPVEPLRARQAKPRSADMFEPGSHTGVFQTPFQAGERPARVDAVREHGDGATPTPGLQPDARAPQGHVPRRRPGQVPAQDQQRGRRRRRQRDDDRPPPDRDRRGHRQRDGRRRGRASRTTTRGSSAHGTASVDVSAPGTKVDGEVRRATSSSARSRTRGRARRRPPHRRPTDPPHRHHPTHRHPRRRTSPPVPPPPPGPRAAARPRRHQVRRADDGQRRRPAHVDDDRDEPLVRRGGGRQRPQARRSPLVPHAADLADRHAGHVPAVHLQSRAARARRVRNGHRRSPRRSGSASWSTSSGSARRSSSPTTATTSPRPSPGSIGR